MGRANDYICPGETTIIGRKGTINKPIYVEEPFWNVDTAFGLVSNKESLIPRYLYHFCRYFNFGALSTTSAIPSLTSKNIERIKLWLPDVDEQEVMVQNLDACLHQIKICEQSLVSFDELIKSRFVEMFGDLEHGYKCPSCELCSVAEVGSSKRVFKSELLSEGVPFYRGTEIADLSAGKPARPNLFISKEHYEKLIAATGRPEAGDLLLPSICPDGQIWCVNTDAPFYFKDGRVLWIRPNRDAIDGVYLRHALSTMFQMSFSSIASGTTFAELKIFLLKGLNIPLPNLKTQKEFAAFVQQVDKLKFIAQRQIEKLQELYDSLAQEYFGV